MLVCSDGTIGSSCRCQGYIFRFSDVPSVKALLRLRSLGNLGKIIEVKISSHNETTYLQQDKILISE